MKVYLDLVMFVNFFLDFLLLLSVSIILKRNANIKRVIFASFIGGLSILALFFKISNFQLFILKFIISLLMVIIAFNYKDFKYTFFNLLYLYITSIFLGGFLYFLNDQFCIHKRGLVFINNKFSITILTILILSPFIIYLYIKQSKIINNNYNTYHLVNIYYYNQCININGFLDTGNNLKYLKNNVILLDKRKMIFDIKKYLLIPYETISGSNILQAFKPDKVIIDGKNCKNILVGIINQVDIDGVDVILNNNIKEIIC